MRRVPLALGAAVVVASALTAASCGDDTAGIVVGEVARADVVEVVDAPAAVVAKASATLTAPAEGTLAELLVEPGEQVRTGQLLAVIESPAAQRRLDQAGAAVAAAAQATPAGFGGGSDLSAAQRATDVAAQAAFDHARAAAGHVADEELAEALLVQVGAAEQHYAAVSAAAAEAVRSVQRGVASLSSAVAAMGTAQQLQAQQAYELAEATVDALSLRAPFAGVVQLGGVAAGADPTDLLGELVGAAGGGLDGLSAVPGGAAAQPAGVDPAMSVGAPVAPGAAVLTVVDTAELGLVAEVDETDILLVDTGVEAEVELDAAPGVGYPATVTSMDVLPTPSARGGVAYRVRLTLGDGSLPDGSPAPAPRPGMSAVAHLRVRQATGAVAVPAAALLNVDGVDMVWLVRDGRATQVPVTVGVQGRDLVQVVSGVRPGDRVVVSGADRVSPGQRL